MRHPFALAQSSLALTGEEHVPPGILSTSLTALAGAYGPYHQPLARIGLDDARGRKSRSADSPCRLEELAGLLHLALFRPEAGRPWASAGGCYVVHVYILAFSVSGLPVGVHYLRWGERSLEYMGGRESAMRFRREDILQEGRESLPVIGLLMVDTSLSRCKYHDRATRLGFIEAGSVLQNLYLAAARLELAFCGLGAVADRSALALCELDTRTEVHLACGFSVGRRAGQP